MKPIDHSLRRSLARGALVGVLVFAGASKIVDLLTSDRPLGSPLATWIVSLTEVVLATVIISARPPAREVALALVMAGFTGAVLVGLGLRALTSEVPSCGCLGRIPIRPSEEFIAQGVVLMLAACAVDRPPRLDS